MALGASLESLLYADCFLLVGRAGSEDGLVVGGFVGVVDLCLLYRI